MTYHMVLLSGMDYVLVAFISFLLGSALAGRYYRSMIKPLGAKITELQATGNSIDHLHTAFDNLNEAASIAIDEHAKTTVLLVQLIDEHVLNTGVPLSTSHADALEAIKASYEQPTYH